MSEFGRDWSEGETVEVRSAPADVLRADGWGDDGARARELAEARRAVTEAYNDAPGSNSQEVRAGDVNEWDVPLDRDAVEQRSSADMIVLADDVTYANRMPSDPETFQLVTHGDADGLQADIDGVRTDLDVDQTAALIESNPGWGGRPVTLYGCWAGEGEFAKHLADRLDVPVTAPTDFVDVHMDGSTSVGSAFDPGEWRTFKPEERDER